MQLNQPTVDPTNSLSNILQFSYSKDQHGYYTVGDYKTYSRLEAFEFCRGSHESIKWHFNEEIYSSYNWKNEPTETLEELYKNRALQLREKYDYIILCYSSGADSQNVLNSFVTNDIKLDEVVSFVTYNATGDKFDHLNGEIFNVAIPRMEKLLETHPYVKYRIVDLAEHVVNYFKEEKTKHNWMYDMNALYNPNNAAKANLKLKIKDWADLITAGKRVGFVVGHEKPYVYDINGECFFKFVDRMQLSSAVAHADNVPWDFSEQFYWSPDAPLITIKQGHILKKLLKNITVDSKEINLNTFGSDRHCGKLINSKMHWVDINVVHQYIYPGWIPKAYQEKTLNMFLTERDTWFFNLKESDKAWRNWKMGLEYLWKHTPEEYRTYDSHERPSGVKTLSNIYSLGS
jgi:hypothetical protein